MRRLVVAAALVMLAAPAAAQTNGGIGTELPSTCIPGSMFIRTGESSALYYCEDVDMWTPAAPARRGVPTGMILFTDTGLCPEGWDQMTEWAGRTVQITTQAAGDVGTTGGSNTVTPQGTNSAPAFTGTSANSSAVSAGTPSGTNSAPSFTGSGWTPPAIAWPAGVPTHSGTAASFSGSAWSAPAISWPGGVPTHSGTAASFSGNALSGHQHELPMHGGTTPRITAGYGTGTSIAGTRSLTNAAQTTSAAVLLSQSVSGGTPSGTVTITNQGTVAWPAGVPTIAAYTPAGSVSISNQGTVAWPAGVPTIGAYTPSGSVTAPSFTGNALGTHQHTVTATGTVAAPSFTGTEFDNRSAYVNVIACRKS